MSHRVVSLMLHGLLASALLLSVSGCAQLGGWAARPSETEILADTEAARTRVIRAAPSMWIGDYAHSPVTVAPGDSVDIRFRTQQPGTVSVQIEDSGGAIVRRLDLGWREAGRIRSTWDGRDSRGQTIEPGLYYSVVSLSAEGGQEDVFARAPSAQGSEVLPQDLSLDRTSGLVSFALPESALVRLMILLENYPVLKTELDWQPLSAGEHSIPVDLVSTAGAFDVRREPRLRVRVDGAATPETLIAVRSRDTQAVPLPDVWPSNAERPIVYSRDRRLPTPRPEPQFMIEFPESRIDASGLPVLDGIQPVRLSLDESVAEGLLAGQFEFMFFADLTFLFEEEEGSNPFTVSLDSDQFSSGLHHLTVNLLTYDGRIGTETISFLVN